MDIIDRVPISEAQDKTPQDVEKQKIILPKVEQTTTSYMDDPEYHQMAEFLDVPYEQRRDVRLAEKLSFLTDWAKEETKSQDNLLARERISQLIRGLGITHRGKELVIQLYQYTRLDSQRRRIEREMHLINGPRP